ncbi:cAMP-dependent protein kinase [Reticulomyxa filosa]|uniref:cAMP-dependent protein kinase n=1 Tax=Reticulomyxa filosa TaxID=46433 RepID=X6MRT0_RETFI|nr:cAMP-dependent protein kinase [Reticulomyxa filosa]|eukprot:ETO16162.1 cAMP-dependent protein kinase [Reticulomyxa filosa]
MITDFGFAKKRNVYVHTLTTTLCGTPQYLAPELVHGWVQGFAVDWWTLGILLYEMVVGHPPFEDDEHVKMYQKIIGYNCTFPKNCSAEFRDIIEKLLEKNAYRRLGSAQGANDIKRHSFFKGFDWQKMEKRELTAPYLPTITSETDLSNFEKVEPPQEEEEPINNPSLLNWADEF